MIQTKEIEYKVDDVVFRAFMANDTAQSKPKPCIMIAPDWSGRTDTFCEKAKDLASQGYVGFAIDMYGNAKTGNTTEAKQALLSPLLANRAVVTSRMLAAYNVCSKSPWVDNTKIAAMGYCFGGLCVLDLARSGCPLLGVISFHGLLMPPEDTTCEAIGAKILVLHGYDDPMAPPAQVTQFAKEMTLKKADWQICLYGNTQHAFTNPEANDDSLGLHYNKKSDQRSWASAKLFLNEIVNNRL